MHTSNGRSNQFWIEIGEGTKATRPSGNLIGIADCEPLVHANSFDFIAVYKEWFPKGWLDGFYQQFQSPGDNDFNQKLLAFVDHLLAGGDQELLSEFRKLSSDLVIISASEFDSVFWALLAHKLKLKCVYLFDVLAE